MYLPLAFLSLLAEFALGYPDRLFKRIGHPVVWIGWLIEALEKRLNRTYWSAQTRRRAGMLAVLILVLATYVVGFLLAWLCGLIPFGIVLVAILASSLLAQRSLAVHVRDVADGLDRGLAEGRAAVSRIVGRDPDQLDEAGVSRAAIESLAENFSDGVVAPAFWLGIGGLGAAVAYKAINTADSMIGHRTPRHEAFGWAAARLDDVVNLPASRLSAGLIVLAALLSPGADAAGAWRAMRRDASRHRSPNAGWPEAAMAGALGLSLAGPRAYNGVMVDDACMGEGGRRDVNRDDIRRALRLYWTADALLVIVIGGLSALVLF